MTLRLTLVRLAASSCYATQQAMLLLRRSHTAAAAAHAAAAQIMLLLRLLRQVHVRGAVGGVALQELAVCRAVGL